MRSVVAEMFFSTATSKSNSDGEAFGEFLGEQLPPEKENCWQLLQLLEYQLSPQHSRCRQNTPLPIPLYMH